MKPRTWTDEQLKQSIESSRSYRQTLISLGLKPKGGNYKTIQKHIKRLGLSTKHLKGHAWNKGLKTGPRPRIHLDEILKENSNFQSFKLKQRLYEEGLKLAECEECGWAKISKDGRLPLELDHINGNSKDNRIENLRILCPNCHSLKTTHRGSKLRNT